MAKSQGEKVKPDLPNFTVIDGKLYVRVYYRNTKGKWRAKTQRVNSQREGFNVLAKLKSQLSDAGPESFDGDRMTFDELLTQYKAAHPNKQPWYIDPIEKYFAHRRIKSITYFDLKRFKTSRMAVKKQIRIKKEKIGKEKAEVEIKWVERKPATIHRELEQLRSIILFAVRHGWLPRNPFLAGPSLIVKAEEEARDRIPTPEEEEKLLKACNDLRHGYATSLMEGGLPKDFAMKLAGHSNSAIHDIYTNIDERLAKQGAAVLDQLHQDRSKPPDPGGSQNVTEGKMVN